MRDHFLFLQCCFNIFVLFFCFVFLIFCRFHLIFEHHVMQFFAEGMKLNYSELLVSKLMMTVEVSGNE